MILKTLHCGLWERLPPSSISSTLVCSPFSSCTSFHLECLLTTSTASFKLLFTNHQRALKLINGHCFCVLWLLDWHLHPSIFQANRRSPTHVPAKIIPCSFLCTITFFLSFYLLFMFFFSFLFFYFISFMFFFFIYFPFLYLHLFLLPLNNITNIQV